MILYAIGKIIFILYFRIFFRVKVSGAENIPKKGGAIICANHIHFLDPLLVGASIRRKIHIMGKKEIFKNRFFAFVLTTLGAFPVDRENPNMSAFKQSIKILKDGKVLTIFAQGTRFSKSETDDAKAGVAFFALKSDACVVPANITSTYKLFSKVHLTFGNPIYLEEYKGKKVRSEGLNEITEKIMREVARLRPESA